MFGTSGFLTVFISDLCPGTCVCDGVELRGGAPGPRQAAPLLPGAGLAGIGRVVVGQGAGRGADVEVSRLIGRRHGGVGRRQPRVGLLVLQVCGGVPGQDAVLHALPEEPGLRSTPSSGASNDCSYSRLPATFML